MSMEKGQLSIHTENFLPIIKKWLYSDRDIFIRELISNCCDAVAKRRMVGRFRTIISRASPCAWIRSTAFCPLPITASA